MLQRYRPPGFFPPPDDIIITRPNIDEVSCYQDENSTNIQNEKRQWRSHQYKHIPDVNKREIKIWKHTVDYSLALGTVYLDQ